MFRESLGLIPSSASLHFGYISFHFIFFRATLISAVVIPVLFFLSMGLLSTLPYVRET